MPNYRVETPRADRIAISSDGPVVIEDETNKLKARWAGYKGEHARHEAENE